MTFIDRFTVVVVLSTLIGLVIASAFVAGTFVGQARTTSEVEWHCDSFGAYLTPWDTAIECKPLMVPARAVGTTSG